MFIIGDWELTKSTTTVPYLTVLRNEKVPASMWCSVDNSYITGDCQTLRPHTVSVLEAVDVAFGARIDITFADLFSIVDCLDVEVTCELSLICDTRDDEPSSGAGDQRKKKR